MCEQAIQSRRWPTSARYAADADPPVLPHKDDNIPGAVPGVTIAW
jgi:hypothetical protein